MPRSPKNHLPNYPLFEHPLFEQFLPELGWGPDFAAVARGLRRHGCAVVDFPHADFDMLSKGIVERLSGEVMGPDAKVKQPGVKDAWQSDKGVKEIATSPSILNLLHVVFGRKPFPFQTQNYAVGTQRMLRSDAVHFNSRPERFLCGVWVALEDAEEDNGPLHYYPGTHSWPIYTTDQLGVDVSAQEHAPNQAPYEPFWSDRVKAERIEPQAFYAKKGQALIYAANLLHGDTPRVDTARTRWSQLTRYYFDDCAYWAPLASNTGMGHTQYRRPVNILTGKPVQNTYLGKPILKPSKR